MLDEIGTFKQSSNARWFRRRGKKKSTGNPVVEKPATVETQVVNKAPTHTTPPVVEPTIISEPLPEAATPKVSAPIVEPISNKPKQTPSLFRKKEDVSEQAVEVIAEKKTEAFSADALIATWQAFAEHRQGLNMGDAEKLVLSRTLSKQGENDVLIGLGSQLEVSILEKFEQELVQFLRQELSNDLILLKKGVQEHKETQKLYTSKDKFDFMAEQNPALRELKDRLGLDFEY